MHVTAIKRIAFLHIKHLEGIVLACPKAVWIDLGRQTISAAAAAAAQRNAVSK